VNELELTTPDVLDGAADTIRHDGWHQGFFHASGTSRVCAVGGMNVTCGRYAYDWEHDDTRRAMASLVKHLGLRVGSDEDRDGDALVLAIGRWNDADNRTAEDVIAALEGAARAERERAS